MKKSKLKSGRIQQSIDACWNQTIIKRLPNWVSPNLLSLIRLTAIIPIVLLFATHHYFWGVLLFVTSALLDSLDGAIARTRKQSSDLGLLLDPLADKLLVIAVILYLLLVYPYPVPLVLIILLDLFLIFISILTLSGKQKPIAKSNRYGKIKMLLQVFGIILALVWLINFNVLILNFSHFIFWLALIFQAVALFSYLYPLQKRESSV